MSLQYYIALGSNLGDREAYLQKAWAMMRETGHITIEAVSSIHETAPWGNTNQGAFLNAVCAVRSDWAPTELLAALQAIEKACGRVREEHWGPRTLDLDILSAFDDGVPVTVAEDILQLPHPYMWERLFVLEPLAEIAPNYTWNGESISSRIAELQHVSS